MVVDAAGPGIGGGVSALRLPPDNADVAAVFLEMAELMQIRGGDPHRARAFSRTAQVLQNLREPIQQLLQSGRVARLPGIGPGSVERIKQILHTGSCDDHARVLATVPPGLRDVMKLRGMGARTTRLAFSHAGVVDTATLKFALASGALARVAGFGPATAARVQQHLHELEHGPQVQLLLSEALAIGARVVDWLLEDPACTDAMQTGSARRRKELIGDLDFVAAASDARAVAQRFLSFPEVRTHLSGDESFCIVVLDTGVQADLRIVPPANYGAGVHHFTGDKQHNIRMRIRANKMSMHVSEKGVWERKLHGRGRGDDNRKIARCITTARTEVEVFAALGLADIAVELRTGQGEIEAAAAGTLPTLVDVQDVAGDFGIVPTDAASARATLHALKAMGRSYAVVLVAADAFAQPQGRAIVEVVRNFEQRHAMRVWCAALFAADAAVDTEALCAAGAELMVASPPPGLDVTDAMVAAINSGTVDMLWQPLGRTLPTAPAPRVKVWDLLSAARDRGVVVAMSGDPRSLDLDAFGARLAAQWGVPLAIASGAPNADHVADSRYAVWQARRGWVTAAAVTNTRDLDAVQAWVSSRGRAPRQVANVPAQRAAAANAEAAHAGTLSAQLEQPLNDATLARVEAFLRGSNDPELEAALTETSDNALERAFALVLRKRHGDL